ncbi:MAG: heavy-metal-associated domain-containing protein [Opitutae bacterium]|nr:heavy-metal-associated domain-containing protein [Opitutae bacterium]
MKTLPLLLSIPREVQECIWVAVIVVLLGAAAYLIIKQRRQLRTVATNMQGGTVYAVEGMHCDNCKMRVENAVRKLQGVQDVVADPKTKMLVVRGEVPEAKIKEVVENLGFFFQGRK